MQKFFFLFFLCAICFSFNACGWQESQRIKALEKSCSKLSSVTGKQYEAIIGYYIADKSYTYGPPSHSSSETYGYNIFLDVNDGEVSVSTGVHRSETSMLNSKILYVFGKNVIRDRTDINSRIGICYFSNSQGYKIGDLSTLVNISHGNYKVDIIDEPNYEEFNTLKNGSSK